MFRQCSGGRLVFSCKDSLAANFAEKSNAATSGFPDHSTASSADDG